MSKTIEPVDPIVARLHDAVKSSPELWGAARLYEAILPLVRDADLGEAPLILAPGQVAELMETGVPLLFGLSFDIDMEAAEELMLQLLGSVAALADTGPAPDRLHFWQRPPQQAPSENAAGLAALKSAALKIRTAFESGSLDLAQVLEAASTADLPGLTATARGLQLDPDLLWTLAQNCLKPALQSLRRQIHPAPEEISWPHGYCFVCGATASLGELQDNVQAKHLRCTQCGADWSFPVLQCTQCGNEEPTTRPHFYLEGQSDRRVEACDVCGSYHKVITAFTPTQPELLVVEDLNTLQLDFVAREKGYLKANTRYTPKPL
jgi:ribosomal protein L37E